jgi:hypothetical protein
MLRKFMSVLAMTVVAFAATAGVASAEPTPYPAPDVPVVAVDDDSIPVGTDCVFSGDNFTPGEDIGIDVSYGSGLRSSRSRSLVAAAKFMDVVKADGAGSFSTTLTLTQVGTATLTATGLTSGIVLSRKVTVFAAGTTASTGTAAVVDDGSGLAYTGASVAGPLTIGATALAAGLALLFFGSRLAIRRKHRTSVQ